MCQIICFFTSFQNWVLWILTSITDKFLCFLFVKDCWKPRRLKVIELEIWWNELLCWLLEKFWLWNQRGTFWGLSRKRSCLSVDQRITQSMKKEFIGHGLHLRPVCADRARPPLQWTLNSVLSACENDSGRVRPLSGQGNLEEKTDTNHPCLRTVSIGM